MQNVLKKEYICVYIYNNITYISIYIICLVNTEEGYYLSQLFKPKSYITFIIKPHKIVI